MGCMINFKTKSYRWLVAALASAQILALTARADDTSDTINDLKKQLQSLTEKVNALEAQQAATAQQQQQIAETQDKTVAKLTNAPYITAGSDGFSLRSANSNFIMNLHGFGQVDSHYYASPTTSAKDELTIRRLRAIISGTVYKDYDYYVQADFGAGNTVTSSNNSLLQDAYVNIHYIPQFQVQAGKMKPPDGLELSALDEYLWFDERGFPYELGPNRDVGVMVHGNIDDHLLSYYAGVYNGVTDGGSGDAETADNDKDLSAKIFALPFKNTQIVPLQKFGLGLGGTYGLQPGDATPTFSTMGRQTFFSYKSTVTEGGEHLRLDPQAYYFWGPFGAYGEYAFSDTKFKNGASSAYFQNKGWDVVGSYFLTGEDSVWNTLPDVRNPLRFGSGGWGAFQVAARIGQISLDPAAIALGYSAASNADEATSWGVSLNWYLNRNVKAIFEFDDTTFGGSSKTPGTVAAQPEKAVLGRLQFGF
jgi:phosphate-selective porin OprO/OprP